MILPAVRERLEAILHQPAVEDALAALRSGANQVALSGLHDVAKALLAAYLTHTLRRPAYFITSSNRRAEALAETLRFFAGIFPGKTGAATGLAGEVATLPAFDTLPWESQSPHPDILERRAATLFRLADGQVSLIIAPVVRRPLALQRSLPLSIPRPHPHQRLRDPPRRIDRPSRLRRLHPHRNGRAPRPVRRPRRHHRFFLARSPAPRPRRTPRRHRRIRPRIRPPHPAFHRSGQSHHHASPHRVGRPRRRAVRAHQPQLPGKRIPSSAPQARKNKPLSSSSPKAPSAPSSFSTSRNLSAKPPTNISPPPKKITTATARPTLPKSPIISGPPTS